MGFNTSATVASSSTTVPSTQKYEPGISFLNMALPNGGGNKPAKMGTNALRASEPIMQKLHTAFASGDADKRAKAEAWIRANIVIEWNDAKKLVKADNTTYDFE